MKFEVDDGYASDDSFSKEVNAITRKADAAMNNGEVCFYTRSGIAVLPQQVDKTPELLASPRFMESMLIEGVREFELMERDYESFEEEGLIKEKQQMRFEFYEKKRREKAKDILETREKVIAKKRREASAPPDSSSMVEKEKHKNQLKRNQMEKR